MAAVAFCSVSYGNLTACQLLANLCTLQLQRLVNENVRSGSACAEFINLESQRTSSRPGFASWAENMPWLYYGSQQASLVLADTSLTATYASGSTINLYLGTYSLGGEFQGFQNASATGRLQLCKDTLAVMQAAFRFGTTYSQQCEINADDLFDNAKYPLTFYDPCILSEQVGIHSAGQSGPPAISAAEEGAGDSCRGDMRVGCHIGASHTRVRHKENCAPDFSISED
nr:unnamed protein product [Spirometra erinaceieuropaei]